MNADGAVLFGGSAPNQQRLLDYVAEDPENRQTDDSLTNFEPVTEAVRKLGREGFEWLSRFLCLYPHDAVDRKEDGS